MNGSTLWLVRRPGAKWEVCEKAHPEVLATLRAQGFEVIPCRPVLSSHRVHRDMLSFFRAIGGTIGEAPAIRNPQANADLILEEAREAAESLTGRRVAIAYDDSRPSERPQSLVGAIDAFCDQLATIYGAAITCGVDLAHFWPEVHRSNMDKQGAPKRADGKVLKPVGWRGPDIAGVLVAMYPETEAAAA